ncbi:hypothetical protein TBLA_0C02670 [Henningerozyma blattae CBS 6284]|uniref:Uncharacterized protein n=1 Tax=Henningerozyma blattae (strain ATCC 34711 / CBS 6284 / DSM 70876 / NBRC 10599 / NRRL Y-10934 / UCD 77-7) TaxID=1071380 RepID=I2H124_HENB6|nr:hypothetical protein TBLA_0C02670 [Tetrapisispora blattae CBS 6284]CCH60076.1 hypothetical protein TBLA_0C02670 [Tetrapisispora blattae CBS 6284]
MSEIIITQQQNTLDSTDDDRIFKLQAPITIAITTASSENYSDCDSTSTTPTPLDLKKDSVSIDDLIINTDKKQSKVYLTPESIKNCNSKLKSVEPVNFSTNKKRSFEECANDSDEVCIKKSKSLKENWDDLDLKESLDIKMVVEYSNDIFNYLYQREVETIPTLNYLTAIDSEYYIKPAMRAVLVDWLIEVHEKFNLTTETLLLAINIMDRFLSTNKVTMSKLQLLAVTSLFMAAKFEEVKLPKLADYSYITDGAATQDEIKIAEMYMLSSLNFQISSSNPLNFLNRILKTDKYNSKLAHMGTFILEHSICCHKFVDIKPSTLAALSMFLAKHIFYSTSNQSSNIKASVVSKEDTKRIWNETVKHYSGDIDILNDTKFQELSKELIEEIAFPTTDLSSLVIKYKQSSREAVFFDVLYWCRDRSADEFKGLFD